MTILTSCFSFLLLFIAQPGSPVKIIWQKTFGGKGQDIAHSIIRTEDGNFLITGETREEGIENNIPLIKVNENGEKVWEKILVEKNSQMAYAMLSVNDGFLLAGTIKYHEKIEWDAYITKINKNGERMWEKIFGGNNEDRILSIVKTTDGNYLLIGESESFRNNDNFDIYLIKINDKGEKLWEKTIGTEDYNERGLTGIRTEDGGYIIGGTQYSSGAVSRWSAYIVKVDENGEKLWERIFNENGESWVKSIVQTSDGNFLIAGGTLPDNKSNGDAYIIKVKRDGEKIWERRFGGKGNDSAQSVVKLSDGNYLLIGGTTSYGSGGWDIYLVKFDENGKKLWEWTTGGSSDEIGLTAIELKNRELIIAGNTRSFGSGDLDFYLIKVIMK